MSYPSMIWYHGNTGRQPGVSISCHILLNLALNNLYLSQVSGIGGYNTRCPVTSELWQECKRRNQSPPHFTYSVVVFAFFCMHN